MTAFGFVIDQRRCIGCHACTVACKAENEVPVGDFRTWVKYTEKGSYPTVKRHFTVLRCNHCDAAPCVEICPVGALHKRPDAIVDLDRDLCIGCSACMQACPYDAIYLNEDTGVAEKCHYCAHRTELGLEPACVIVCPEEAIVSGDVADPDSKIASLIRDEPTSQRKLDKGTRPRVWYVDALEESLVPGMAAEPESWIWSERRRPPATVPGFESVPDLITTLNVDHPPAWGWHIWTYLLTKNIAAGAMLLAPFLGLLDVDAGVWPEWVALVFLGITSFLLVHDLGRPERFLKILTHGNSRSWLVKGSYVLMVFGGLTTASLAARFAGLEQISDLLRWLDLPAAALASGYSAFLFAQCKGRELWLERGLFGHLILHAALCGAVVGMLLPRFSYEFHPLGWVAGALAFANLAWFDFERKRKTGPEAVRKARQLLYTSPAGRSAAGWLVLGSVACAGAALFPFANWLIGSVAAVATFTGLFQYERAWVKAGQEVAIS
ncbi:MAG TPA: 4Fe-4S dicluster domain-containing protein [Planctomycetota bacterium]